MKDRRLLFAGLGLVAVGLMGMSVLAPAGGWGGWGGLHAPMMGWWGPGGTSSQGAAPVAGAPTVVIEATEFAFEPNRVVTGAGEVVNITLVNRGSVLHDLTIPALGVHLVAGPGETAATGLSGPTRGEYPILCTVPGHAEAGMAGMLVVEGS